MSEPTAYILCSFADRSSLYQSWLPYLTMRHEIVFEDAVDWTPPDDAAIVITHMHYRWDEIHCLRKIYSQNKTPILILADGILEYRNLYEHPDLADGSIFHPLIGHKLACIGHGQARVIESWGNVGKCEVVGLPRLDSLAAHAETTQQSADEFRLLICTANTPAFNDKQRASVVESLQHILSRLKTNPKINGRTANVTWRLTDGLGEELGLDSEAELADDSPETRQPLLDVIRESDAVITTPSTVFLESALLNKPTAILDFHNTPHFVPAAWMINAPKHLNAILNELAEPPAPKMLFQNMVLHDQLECQTPATPRLIALIDQMVEQGQLCRTQNRSLEFAPRMLPAPRLGFAVVESGFPLKNLFPENPVLQNSDQEQLQLEFNQAIQRVGTLRDEIAHLEHRNAEMKQAMDELQIHCKETTDRLMRARGRILKLREKIPEFRDKPLKSPRNRQDDSSD
ncbi:MAG: hypothetical protein R3C03_20020 [Pirellulaceae bacterium]